MNEIEFYYAKQNFYDRLTIYFLLGILIIFLGSWLVAFIYEKWKFYRKNKKGE